MTAPFTLTPPIRPLASEYPAMNRTQRKSSAHAAAMEALQRRRLIEVERKTIARAEALAVSRGIEESEALAEARGEVVDALPSGARRIDRDPLMSLLRAGRLTPDQFDIGIEVRDLYDARSEDVGSQLGAMSGAGGGHDNSRFVYSRLQRAKKLQRLGRTERTIALRCADEPNTLQMFRAVCGQSIPLSAFGAGRAFERNAKALCRALDVAGDVR